MFALGFVVAVACRREPDRPGAPAPSPSTDPKASLLEARPYREIAPAGVTGEAAPLVLLLHGYSGNGESLDNVFHFEDLARDNGAFLAVPDGSHDTRGARFWNATDACCNFYGSAVDDVAYLGAVVADMKRKHPIDPKRVYVIGFSNGGFMAHRLACDMSPEIAAIVTLGAMGFKDVTRCRPKETVAVLEVNGDADRIILYDGGVPGGGLPHAAPYPSAEESVQGWAVRNRCSEKTHAAPIDIARDIEASETSVERWAGCAPGGAAELWTIHGAGHVPRLSPAWSNLVWHFLSAHPKP